jgi:hypothetical protein
VLRGLNSRAIEAQHRWQNRKTNGPSTRAFTGDAGFADCEPFWLAERRGFATTANQGDKFAHRLPMLDFEFFTKQRNRLSGLVSHPTLLQPQRGETFIARVGAQARDLKPPNSDPT